MLDMHIEELTSEDEIFCEYCEEPIEPQHQGVAITIRDGSILMGVMFLHKGCYHEVKLGYDQDGRERE
jgi:hypothetical protein